jgi:hypothetical protein
MYDSYRRISTMCMLHAIEYGLFYIVVDTSSVQMRSQCKIMYICSATGKNWINLEYGEIFLAALDAEEEHKFLSLVCSSFSEKSEKFCE